VAGDERGLRVGRGGADLRFEMVGEAEVFSRSVFEVRPLFTHAARCGGGPVTRVAVPVQRGDIDIERMVAIAGGGVGHGRFGAFGRGVVGAQLARFEQRVAVQRLANEGLDFEVRQRQQLDRLLQLRRHHQRLRLAEIEAGAESHALRVSGQRAAFDRLRLSGSGHKIRSC
jgi:hypothetical protein